ncbi:hypothetical protein RCIX645 [Methanocella arvoryzae MRE50]|uniref:Methyltransferase n=1 Tax=Methanocella arvoryzae (strain DSM 22066 / NBRC 105507 / MRE50) TaxID=351160 RepID=Q0W6E7_METAR|nr:hypothetical protein RCIX645 [Methanocella arvoryzae MRE50]
MHMQPAEPPADTDDLRIMSSDLLNIMEHRGNLPGHPDFAHVITSRDDWEARAPELEADIRTMLPPGSRFFLTTPFGDAGDVPPDCAPKFVRPFQAFVPETNTIVECRLIVWRA